MAQITVKNLSLGYEGRSVVENLSFSVSKGDYLCIVGENGSGKSTLIKALLRLNKPISGNIFEGDGFHYKNIGYLPQQTQIQRDFPASVDEVVLSGCVGRMRHLFFGKKEKQTAKNNMEKLGILHLANHSYRDLSGGQQQRVLLARALCAAGDMLLLDEPVAGLDPKITSELYELIAKLNREDGITVVMVSHDIGGILQYATHILHINAEHHFFGSVAEYAKRGNQVAFAETEAGGNKDGN